MARLYSVFEEARPVARRLWEFSERLTGVTYRFDADRKTGGPTPTEMAAGPGSLRYDEPG